MFQNGISLASPLTKVIARNRAYPDEQFRGRITSIDSRIDPVTRSVRVRAKLANDDERYAQVCCCKLPCYVALMRLILPEKALLPIQNRQYVFVLTP